MNSIVKVLEALEALIVESSNPVSLEMWTYAELAESRKNLCV